MSTSNDAGYRIGTGTSPSTAIVAGVAALVWSKYPDLTNVELLDHLTATAVDNGAPGQDPDYGFGVVDPMAALTTEPERTPTTTTSPPLPTAPVTVPNDDQAAAGLVLYAESVAIATDSAYEAGRGTLVPRQNGRSCGPTRGPGVNVAGIVTMPFSSGLVA